MAQQELLVARRDRFHILSAVHRGLAMRMSEKFRRLIIAFAGIAGSFSVSATDYPEKLLWGDTHVHSNNSPDAYFLGNRAFSPKDAYDFAKGKPLTLAGTEYHINRPLDFLVVADHAEYLGVFPNLDAENRSLLATELGRRWIRYVRDGDYEAIFDEFVASLFSDEHRYETSAAFERSVWHESIRASDDANEPGEFTALTGFEWTSMPSGNNLHRNVIFADGFDRVSMALPFSQLDSDRPEDLWRYMANYEAKTGGRVLAIPHNANLSNGLMFALEDREGRPMTTEHARERRRWEPIVEVTQIKGDSEAHPLLSPEDAWADFETWETWSGADVGGTERKTEAMLEFEYARAALKNGLRLAAALPVNPFEFGMIGSSDSHTSMAAVEEDNYLGKFIVGLPKPGRWRTSATGGTADADQGDEGIWRQAASGYVGVWSTANTRSAIFDALLRREVYASTGPRIALRFFAGFGLEETNLAGHDLVGHAYAAGVPMGGKLTAADGDAELDFFIIAARDPEGQALSRLQVVKGGLTTEGEVYERVFDIKVAAEAGVGQFATFWRDPEFDPRQRAFYYVRVLEVPSPRWTAFDKARFNEHMPAKVPLVIQERVYSSPIWYEPRGRVIN